MEVYNRKCYLVMESNNVEANKMKNNHQRISDTYIHSTIVCSKPNMYIEPQTTTTTLHRKCNYKKIEVKRFG